MSSPFAYVGGSHWLLLSVHFAGGDDGCGERDAHIRALA